MTNHNYLLPVFETIEAAWNKVKGSKATIWGSLILVFISMFLLGMIDSILQETAPSIAVGFDFLVQVFAFLLQMGMMYIGIKRAQDLPISYRQVLYPFNGRVAIRVIALYLLQVLLLIFPIAILISGGIIFTSQQSAGFIVLGVVLCAVGFAALFYIGVRMTFSMAFVLDKLTGPWQAVVQSFSITRGNFLRIVALIGLQGCIILISVIPLGIGLIWTIPFSFILYGLMYQRLSLNNLGGQ